MIENPEKHDFLTWSIQNFIRKVKQFVTKYYITWLIDFAEKSCDTETSRFHFMPCVIKNCLVLLTNLIYEIQFNSLYINMWLSSLNIFEENQFYEKIKRETFNSINLWLRLYK